MKQKIKSALFRFIRGGIATSISVMAILVSSVPQLQSFSDIGMLLKALAISGIAGFISGFIMAADKFFRMTVEN